MNLPITISVSPKKASDFVIILLRVGRPASGLPKIAATYGKSLTKYLNNKNDFFYKNNTNRTSKE